MCKKTFLLICFVLLLAFVGEALGALEVEYRGSWWSDLEPANHLWSEPNNWWTTDYCWDTINEVYVHVKVHPNMVPDVNIDAYIGKGEAHQIYPLELHNMILDGYVMTDPTIDGTVVAGANDVLCGGGASFDSDSGAFRFFSYRDPRLAETLQDFDNSIEWLLSKEHPWREVEEAILGLIGTIDKPGSPAGEAKSTFHASRHGRTPEYRNQFRQKVLKVTEADLKRVAETYLKPERAHTAVISDPTTLEKSDLGLEIIHL